MSEATEIFINTSSEQPSLDDWQKMGQPKIWLPIKTIFLNRLSHKKKIQIWSDVAYGKLRVDVNGHVEEAEDMVQCGEFIVLGEAYGYVEPTLFRRVGK